MTDKNRKTEFIIARITKDLKQKIEKKALKIGENVSDYVRETLTKSVEDK